MGGDGRALHRRRSSGLRFQFFSVEVFSLLPHTQRNGCNLARQCETRHGGLDAFSQRSLVEILEWSGLHTGPGGGSFEQAFQIMVVILVEAANGDLLFRASQGTEPDLLNVVERADPDADTSLLRFCCAALAVNHRLDVAPKPKRVDWHSIQEEQIKRERQENADSQARMEFTWRRQMGL
jgi:hypothetical protein